MEKETKTGHIKKTIKENFDLIVTIGAIVTAFFWVKTESRSDYRDLSNKIDSSNIATASKIDGLISEIHQWNMNFQERVTRLEVKAENEEKK